VLLASFCEHDIAKVVNNLSKKQSKDKRVNRIRNGISDFLQSVCDDLIELYPNILDDNEFVLRLLKRLLEKSANKANGEAVAVVDTTENEA
jgi:predicted transcriptional regulator